MGCYLRNAHIKENSMTRALILATLFLTSCSGQWLARMYDREAVTYLENGIYLKNADTGLCFLIANSYRAMTAVCIPCDSLENVKVVLFYPQKAKQ